MDHELNSHLLWYAFQVAYLGPVVHKSLNLCKLVGLKLISTADIDLTAGGPPFHPHLRS